jgi:heat shock protein HtpX
MMWEQIRSNRVRSVVLITGMAILLLLLGYVLGLYFFNSPVAGLVIALVIWGIMSLVAYFQGDSIILASARARKITRDDYPRLYNVVEEMKIASGLEKVPDIYIIDDPALNAFATGRDPNRASVAITSGLLQKLNRDELQGVIAHEISHIKNRDVLLMAITTVMLGTIVILAWYASRFLIFGGMGNRSRSSSKSGGGYGQIIILVVGLVLIILAPIAAQLIYFAVSRKREYLADASGALYTRYPEGLASALEKLATGPELKSANKATAPMYITNPFKTGQKSLTDLTSTHPPLADRIRILRAMAGVSYTDYDKAYREVRGQGIIPAATAASVGAVGLRAASEAGPVGDEQAEKVARTREVTGVMEHLSNYRVVDCQCGAILKVPPEYKSSQVQCPRCGRTHRL